MLRAGRLETNSMRVSGRPLSRKSPPELLLTGRDQRELPIGPPWLGQEKRGDFSPLCSRLLAIRLIEGFVHLEIPRRNVVGAPEHLYAAAGDLELVVIRATAVAEIVHEQAGVSAD